MAADYHGSPAHSATSQENSHTVADPNIAARFTNETTPLLANGNADLEQLPSEPPVPLQHTLSAASKSRVQQLAAQRDATRSQLKDAAGEPISVVQRPDGTEAEVIIGASTLPQTIFNSANVLIGVGLLSLPLAFRYSGWVFGLLGLLASAVVTRYTAGLLAKCLDVDHSLANFADIAFVAFGEKGRTVTSCVITLELMVACVGLVILFADSLSALFEGPEEAHWKIICGLMLLPLNFLPMKWLGFTSFLGIFCSMGLILVAFALGLATAHGPGSLLDVATTTAFPEHWAALPLSIGLIMGTPFRLNCTQQGLIGLDSSLGRPQHLPEHLSRHARSAQVRRRSAVHVRLCCKSARHLNCSYSI